MHRLKIPLGIIVSLALVFASGCSLPASAYVENATGQAIRVAITTDDVIWTYWLQPGEVVSMVSNSSCELRDLHWVLDPAAGGRPLGTLAQLCPGDVWVISGVGAQQVTKVPSEWATKPPRNVATLPAWSPTR